MVRAPNSLDLVLTVPGTGVADRASLAYCSRHVIDPLVLSFDLDDTLWPVGPVIAAAEEAMLAWLRTHHPETVSAHSMETLRAQRAALPKRYPDRGHDLTFLRHRALKDLFLAAGQSDALADVRADEGLEVFFVERNRVQFYADVRPALTRLRSRYRLFAISNGNADLARCGIAELFDGHITASAAGAAKPDPRIFRALIQATGVEASRVLHIGDDPLADVVGATRAGMQAVWINRDAKQWPESFARPSRTISTLEEIS